MSKVFAPELRDRLFSAILSECHGRGAEAMSILVSVEREMNKLEPQPGQRSSVEAEPVTLATGGGQTVAAPPPRQPPARPRAVTCMATIPGGATMVGTDDGLWAIEQDGICRRVVFEDDCQ